MLMLITSYTSGHWATEPFGRRLALHCKCRLSEALYATLQRNNDAARRHYTITRLICAGDDEETEAASSRHRRAAAAARGTWRSVARAYIAGVCGQTEESDDDDVCLTCNV